MSLQFQSFDDVQSVLNSRKNYEKDRQCHPKAIFKLERMARIVEALGMPQRAFRTVHVAGTKGKGSVCRMLAALLQATGLTVGLYTSPHVEHLRERIAIDSVPVDEEGFVAAFNEMAPWLDTVGKDLTYFELLTAAAFCAFRRARVEYAVIEVGIGGRLDATNVIEPDVCVITNVDYDHMDLLGETLEQIASEKAGIIKPGIPVICGVPMNGPLATIKSRAAELNSPLYLLGKAYHLQDFIRMGYRSVCVLQAWHREWRNVMLNCPAAFMMTNAAHAVAAFSLLHERGLVNNLEGQALQNVLASVELPARCEVFPGSPTIMIDSAHNAVAASSLASVIRTSFEGRNRILLVGVPRDKEVGKIMVHLAESGADRAIFTRYPSRRSTPPQDLVPIWQRKSSAPAEVIEQPESAFQRALDHAGSQGIVVVTGSIYLAGILRPLARSRNASWSLPLEAGPSVGSHR
jgi:dihydrofolate synthase / folylpolyglutamate synthase